MTHLDSFIYLSSFDTLSYFYPLSTCISIFFFPSMFLNKACTAISGAKRLPGAEKS